MAEYEPVIGMEVHAELLTESKMFCRCSTRFGAPPNSQTCPVCLGLPGSLPVANQQAIEFVVKTALALNCQISAHSIFHRKNYFYPDLPKGYQISQYGQTPIGVNGYIDIVVDGQTRRVRIRRVHLEEDTGKLFHVDGDQSLIDFNRSTVPLMEIVTEPDIHSAEEAREYLVRLRAIVTYLGVCDGKMEQGSLRCEPNISVRPAGTQEMGTRTELKNLNSFRAVYRGIQSEVERQIGVLNQGGKITHQTFRWDDVNQRTELMRSKEYEEEYRYFPEPDLVPLHFTPEWIHEQQVSLPELPETRKQRFVSQYSLPVRDAEVLTDTRSMADLFEDTVARYPDAKTVSNWLVNEFVRILNSRNQEVEDTKLTPGNLADLLKMVSEGKLAGPAARTVLEATAESGEAPDKIVAERGLGAISDVDTVESAVDQVISEQADAVAKIKAGKVEAIQFLVGQVMRATKGRARPDVVRGILEKKILG